MPEGPETKVIADQLNATSSGAILQQITVLSGRYERHGEPEGLALVNTLDGLLIESVQSKGKFIYFTLQGGKYIFNTLAMTGSWMWVSGDKVPKHARLRLDTSKGPLLFIDARNFGTLKVVEGEQLLSRKLDSLGWDPLRVSSRRCPIDLFMHKMQSTRSVCEVLMDQSIFAGVGNYIKAEVLYRAKISPHRLANTLRREEWEEVRIHVADVMRESYAAGGTTIRDYRDAAGTAGTFQHKLQVYGQRVDPLNNPVVKETTLDGRTTHWVPQVQR